MDRHASGFDLAIDNEDKGVISSGEPTRRSEFRRRALDLVARGEPVARTAKDLGISESCLRRWMERDAIDSGRKDGVTTQERDEFVALRRRNRLLEMENEILKRASAYFSRENVLPK